MTTRVDGRVLAEKEVPGATARIRSLPPQELATDPEAARLVARLTRKGVKESAPVRVAAFNSYI